MSNRALCLLATAMIAGCAADLPSSRAPASATLRSMLFVQAMIVEVPASRIGDVAGASLAEIAALPGASLLTSPSMIVQDGVTATFETGPGPSVHLAVRGEVLADDEAWLDIRLTGDVEASASQPFHNSQAVVLPATRPAVHGGTTVLVVQSDVVRDDADVGRLRRERCPDCT